jgi:hypothetical protein
MSKKFNWDDKSNNEILLEIKQMEYDYESLKQKMLHDFDALVEIETKYLEANKIIKERLKGNV